MNIYTFHEDLDSSHELETQNELMSLWKNSWVNNGWNPIVLNNDLAKTHHYYKEFSKSMKLIHAKITGNKIKKYGLYCYTRWLAFSALESDEPIFVCDYDLINNGLKPRDIIQEGGIHFMSDYCPCFVSGSSHSFFKLTKVFKNISEMRVDSLKNNIFTSSGLKSNIYHDQDVLVNNFSNQHCDFGSSLSRDMNLKFSNKFVGQMNHKKTFDNFLFKKKLPKALHFSRSSMERFKRHSPSDLSLDELRISIIREKFANY